MDKTIHGRNKGVYMPLDNALVMGVMKMGNIVPLVGLEPTPLAFRASVLPITSPRLPDVTIIPTPTCLCSLLPESSMQTTLLIPLVL